MSLFNRPAWAKSQTTEVEEADTNIFSHSSRSFNQIVAEQERKKQQKVEKKKIKAERRSSGKRVSDEGVAESSKSKRRRISNEQDDDDEEDEFRVQASHAKNGDDRLDVSSMKTVPIRRSPRKNKYADVMSHSFLTQPVIDLEDEYDEKNNDVVLIPPAQPVADDLADEESDPEFAELAQRAREQRERQNKKSQTPDVSAFSTGRNVGDSDSGQHNSSTELPDPTIALFITSEIPDTKSIIIHRKLSQRLQEPLEAWCMRQNFAKEVSQQVFFVHRMRKVYPVTTCKSLGLEVDPLGNLTLKGAEGKEDLEKVHLEAVTDEIYQQMKDERAREAKQRRGELPAEEPAETEVEAPAEETLIPVILRARGKQDFHLKVRPTTKFSKIAAAYAKKRETGEQSLRLEFDGERLDPDVEVQETEVSDMDIIDVHIT